MPLPIIEDGGAGIWNIRPQGPGRQLRVLGSENTMLVQGTLAVGLDPTNGLQITNSNGAVTFTASGSGAAFTFAGGTVTLGVGVFTSTTSPQLTVGYDGTNKLTLGISSAGVATMAVAGSAPSLALNGPASSSFVISAAGAITTTPASAQNVTTTLAGGGSFGITGGVVNFNVSSNFAVNILTGTSTGALNMGNSLAGAVAVISGAAINLTPGAASTLALVANTATAWKITDGTNNYYAVDTRTTVSASMHTFSATGGTITAAAGVTYSLMNLSAGTLTLTGTTTVTALAGLQLNIGSPTVTDASAVAATTVSTVIINGPLPAGSVTFTNSFALDIPTFATNGTTAAGMRVAAPTGAGTNYGMQIVSGGLNIVAGQILMPDGTNSAPSFSFVNTTGTGMYTVSGNPSLGLSVNGTARLFLHSDGRVYGSSALGLIQTTGLNNTSGNLTLSTTTSGTLAVTSAGALNFTGVAASTWANSGGALIIQSTSQNFTVQTVTSGTLAVTSAGALNFTGVAASTWAVAAANLTISTTTSGTLAVTSAGALNLTGAAASTWAQVANTAAAVKFTDGTNAYYTIDTRTGANSVLTHSFTNTAPSFASTAGNSYALVYLSTYTITQTGTTTITALTGLSLNIDSPTVTNTSVGLTITTVSAVRINGPLPAGNATFTNSFAVDIPTFATNGTTAAGLRVAAPTGAGTNQGIQIVSGGLTITAGGALISSGNLTVTALTANAPLYSGAAGLISASAALTNTLGADVTLTSAGTYYDGPSVSNATAGTWLAMGTVEVTGTASDVIKAKLWDGTTVIDSCQVELATVTGTQVSIHLSGRITTPAGNIRISVTDATTGTTPKIVFNQSGNSADSTLTAWRIG